MIFFDVTKSAKSRHVSGLMRVNQRLREELGSAVTLVEWGKWDVREAAPDDWYLCTEIFDVDQRVGFEDFLQHPTCRTAAMFPDAIPLKFPQITWPHAVARHPRYMHTLGLFHHVFGISAAVKHDLESFWAWQGNPTKAVVSVLPLGADFDGSVRSAERQSVPDPVLLCVGIVEPRKNQTFLIDVAETLWGRGVAFELHIVGRVNPHFGPPIVEKMKQVSERFPQLKFHEGASDAVFAGLLERSRALVFPTIAEGCGLPVLESLWRGLPCVCSALPVLQENALGGGCLSLEPNDSAAWEAGLTRILTDDEQWRQLAAAAASRALPTWAASAAEIRRRLV